MHSSIMRCRTHIGFSIRKRHSLLRSWVNRHHQVLLVIPPNMQRNNDRQSLVAVSRSRFDGHDGDCRSHERAKTTNESESRKPRPTNEPINPTTAASQPKLTCTPTNQIAHYPTLLPNPSLHCPPFIGPTPSHICIRSPPQSSPQPNT